MPINLTLRGVKGTALTYQEVDANFTELKDAVEATSSVDTSSFVTTSSLATQLAGYATTSSLSAYVTTSTAQSVTGTKTFRGIQETVYAYGTVSGTIAPDATSGTIQTMTLSGELTLNALTSPQAGQSVTLKITQDGTGGRTLTSTMKFAGGSKTLSTSSNAIDIVNIVYDGSDYLAALIKGFA
jgi:hypothetical protein